MVREAIKALDSRKGVSSQAIQNYIKQKYPSVDLVRLKGLVRNALKKGIESGTLVRPANATATTGATGRFRLPPKSKEPKAKSENVDPNLQKAPKSGTGEAKKKKPAAKKELDEPKDESSEEPKPAKKSKKHEEDVLPPKVAPAKKPKATKKAAAAETEEVDEHEPVKLKGKAKAIKEDEEQPEKGKATQKRKAAQSKAQVAKSDEAPGKRGKASE
ncbi:protein B4 [Periophthalmus magnuspinnatus]|uniref:protein B4 n=1 Tax=Periophthalmus magnuspinnatus TaxID=409849 RepID=UPI002436B6A5|nr:protein B4 [Periophthalmus magnuspinnatus]